ncbi:Crp/Fnr family transcriptional regulator [Nitrosospira lacus]|uniref:Crp/Fnr family transcriptional regulator n=1 Tax=Nitrosospira lacus TaxID=1288494 RepID=UPI00059428F8|nr:Crp/Fnr family transcriptional regulator [Nitrosospira lacus]
MSYLHTPKQNLFLAALPEEVYERLKSCLELVSLPEGWAVYEDGGEIDRIYFPTTSIISLLATTEDGMAEKIAIIGNEGLFGIAMLMGRKAAPNQAIVQKSGYSYRLKAANLRREFELGSPLRYLLQRYTQSLTARIAQTAMRPMHSATGTRMSVTSPSSSHIDTLVTQALRPSKWIESTPSGASLRPPQRAA